MKPAGTEAVTAQDIASVADLRIAGAVGDRLRIAARDAVTWTSLVDAPTPGELRDLRPHFVLLEHGGGGGAPDVDHLTRCAEAARSAARPAALWLTSPETPDARLRDLIQLVDVVTCADPGMARRLSGTGASIVGLPHAASLAALAYEPGSAPAKSVGVVIEAGVSWPRKSAGRIDAILDAIPPDALSVFAVAPVAPGLPDGLLARAESGDGHEALATFVRRCGVVITALPDSASVLYVPPVVFDASGLGVPVVVPRAIGRGYVLPRICGVARDPAQAQTLITLALERGELASGRREAARRSVRHEHTYSHRLATVASVFSHAVLPAPPRPSR